METKYEAGKFEREIYRKWEESGAFELEGKHETNESNGTNGSNGKRQPYTIIMPPPNANASLHAGHGMYTVDDILIRWKRMQGFSALWIPGMDHAGFETQFVYEKYLSKQGKSRMDFDRKTLYENVAKFVSDNSGLIYEQFKRLGFSADWKRSVFSLDKYVVDYVFQTFKKMANEKLVYRGDYMVNYCTHCGTSLAELEVKHVERFDPLYYIKYGPFVLATVRPETKFGDTAVAVHPTDKRYQKYIGQEIEVEGLLGKFKLKVIADSYVDQKFGTGVVKITPYHDPNDFEVWKRHPELPQPIQVINLNGKLNAVAGRYQGLKAKVAREMVADDLQKAGLMEKIDLKYLHNVTICYKCGRDLEPMVIPNWFVKVAPLKPAVIEAVKNNKIRFYPARFKKQMLTWMDLMHDWPISRQIAWGIRIPVWYEINRNPELQVVFLDKNKQIISGNIKELIAKYKYTEIENGLQTLSAPNDATYVISQEKPEGEYLQETNTFDTWFSSSQWPLVTLKDNEYESRFPTNVMGTLSDILRFWVSRMIMFSLYLKNEIPFKNVYLWSMVTDTKGQKMSKSKGNVINPIDLVDKYGADAFRMALTFGTAPGAKVALSEDKVRAMRNFTNKIWNATRFILMKRTDQGDKGNRGDRGEEGDKMFLRHLENVVNEVAKQLSEYRIGLAAETVYSEFWHWFCDKAVEDGKRDEISQKTLLHGLITFLKLLHPFVPFVTEKCWEEIKDLRKYPEMMLIEAPWPAVNSQAHIQAGKPEIPKAQGKEWLGKLGKLGNLGKLGVLGILIATASIITMAEDKKTEELWEERERIETETKRLAEMTIQYPNYRDLLYKLGEKQWQIGNIEAAKKAWEEAEYLDPNNEALSRIDPNRLHE